MRSFRRAAEIDRLTDAALGASPVAYAQNLGTPVDPARVKRVPGREARSVELAVRLLPGNARSRPPSRNVSRQTQWQRQRAGCRCRTDASVVAMLSNDSPCGDALRLEPDRAPSAIVDTGGTPAEGTETIEMLERVLEREPTTSVPITTSSSRQVVAHAQARTQRHEDRIADAGCGNYCCICAPTCSSSLRRSIGRATRARRGRRSSLRRRTAAHQHPTHRRNRTCSVPACRRR